MIIANIRDAEKYCSIDPRFIPVFEFLKTLREDSDGGIEGEDWRVNFSGKYSDTSDKAPDGTPKVFEAHRKYIDIHYCISGSEGIGYADVKRLTPITEYNETDDYVLLSGEYQRVILQEGDLCICFPEDAHIPLLKGATDGKVLKAVAKIKV